MNNIKYQRLDEVFKPFIHEKFYSILQDECIKNPAFNISGFFEKLYSYPLINKELSTVYYYKDTPAGFQLFSTTQNQVYLIYIYTALSYRSKGLAKSVLKKFIAELNEKGYKKLILDVRKDNNEAVSLYKSLGFINSADLVSFRNESNSFYRNKITDTNISTHDKYTFQPLFRSICSPHNRPWERRLFILLKKIEEPQITIKVIKDNSNTVKGYIIYEIKDYTLYLIDIYTDTTERLCEALTLIINDQKIVRSCLFYSDDPICLRFEEAGFFPDIKQIEMTKVLNETV